MWSQNKNKHMLNKIGGFIASKIFLYVILALSVVAIGYYLTPNSFYKQTSQANEVVIETVSTKITKENLSDYEGSTHVRAVNTSGNNDLEGLNVRKEPCSEEIVGGVDWGTAGMIVDPEIISKSCFGYDYQWVKVVWENGLEGYSSSEFVEFKILKEE
jgi:hypothetical protein